MKARSQLILGQAFYGSLAVRQKFVPGEVDKLTCDGETVEYNPAYVESLSEAQLQGALAMAVSRVALQHHCRMGDRDAETWQKSSEKTTNPMLRKAGFTLPADADKDDSFAGKSCEEAYGVLWLEKQQQQSQQGQGQGAGNGPGNGPSQGAPGNQPGQGTGAGSQAGSGAGNPASDPAAKPTVQVKQASDPAAAQQKSRIETLQACQAAKAMGDTSADIESLAKCLLASTMPWQALLRDFLSRVAKNDFNWQRPNRKYMARGLYVPSLRGVEMGSIAVFVDTSGSLSEPDLEKFGGEIKGLLDEMHPERAFVVYCDTKIQRVDEFAEYDDFELKAKGRGGTSFIPPFEWLASEGHDVAAIVYLTDLDCNRYPSDPGIPTIWVVQGNSNERYGRPPFGEVVKLSEGGIHV